MKGVIWSLKKENNFEISQLLNGARISLDVGGYSYYDGGKGRSDAYGVSVLLYVNPIHFESLDNDKVKENIRRICDRLIPAEVGYDIKRVTINIDLSIDFELEDDLVLDLEKQSDRLSGHILTKILPKDIKEKGIYMAEVYTYLYAVENSLRLFIEEVGKLNYGENYFEEIQLTKNLRNTITTRKEKATLNKWLSVRGASNLFYLDFKDLGAIIDNNWNIFKIYFPSRDFIIPKIDEMSECRNLIAHNSLIEKTERDVIRTYYNLILKQISIGFEKNNVD